MQVIKLTHNDIYKILPDRKAISHKGDYGKILMLCGSRGYTGAAVLAAMGALRVGAGLVYLGVPECIYEIEAVKLLEPIVFPLPDNSGCLSDRATEEILKILPQMDVVLIGCGLGRASGVEEVVQNVICNFNGPVVIDADGINVLQDHKDILRGRKNPIILTPHEGEFVRFAQQDILPDRLRCAYKLAADLGIIVVLKGHQTVITDGKLAYQNSTGNPGMAVGGCGDVLAGMIAGLVGQGIPAVEAAAGAVWLHGTAGDMCAQELGQYGMLPSDMLQVVPRLMK